MSCKAFATSEGLHAVSIDDFKGPNVPSTLCTLFKLKIVSARRKARRLRDQDPLSTTPDSRCRMRAILDGTMGASSGKGVYRMEDTTPTCSCHSRESARRTWEQRSCQRPRTARSMVRTVQCMRALRNGEQLVGSTGLICEVYKVSFMYHSPASLDDAFGWRMCVAI